MEPYKNVAFSRLSLQIGRELNDRPLRPYLYARCSLCREALLASYCHVLVGLLPFLLACSGSAAGAFVSFKPRFVAETSTMIRHVFKISEYLLGLPASKKFFGVCRNSLTRYCIILYSSFLDHIIL